MPSENTPPSASVDSIVHSPCFGCGATKDSQRCIGCMHDFGTPESEWVRDAQKELARKVARLQAIPSLVESVKRIQHFATGSCDMPLKTRLECIAKECEASLSKVE